MIAQNSLRQYCFSEGKAMKQSMRPFWGRLEIKIFAIVTVIMVASLLSFSWITRIAYHDAILQVVRERTKDVNSYAKSVISPSSFALFNTKDDGALPEYTAQQKILDAIRKIAVVRYLFTAKYNEAGQVIYAVDGLPLGVEDFRFAGDLVEDEIVPQLRTCLAGQVVESGKILETSWGPIFLTCQPVINDDNTVVGAIVMEFDAQQIDKVTQASFLHSLMMAFVVATIFVVLGLLVLRKVSEPFYKRLAYTDYTTGLKNRMAFEQELGRLDKDANLHAQMTIIIYDLNNLKLINDEAGHEAGDRYLKRMGQVLGQWLPPPAVNFRLGGDEFVTILQDCNVEELTQRLRQCFEETRRMQHSGHTFSFSYGIATFDPKKDRHLRDLLHRADMEMYAFKSRCKASTKG